MNRVLQAHVAAARRAAVVALLAALTSSCEKGDAPLVGPRGREAFTHFVSIGTGISMGVQSAGVVYSSQAQAWPAQLSNAVGGSFAAPLLRTPGCFPPLIAPLARARFLSGNPSAVSDSVAGSVVAGDSTCSGTLGPFTPPLNNVAIAGATAGAALNLTPKLVAAAVAKYDSSTRALYPVVLASTQSQVTAMLVQGPSFVSVELGFAELLPAAISGRLAPATSYTQIGFTYVPAPIFAPVFSAIADSVKRSRAGAVLLSVPHVTRLASMRPAAELWAARDELAAFGVTVSPDCNGSANLIVAGAVVPLRAALALASITPRMPRKSQLLSCADIPGASDYVLTPSDVALLDGITEQMNAQIRQVAEKNGWAFADLDAVYAGFVAGRVPYRASEQLNCVYPYGRFMSLDGVHPNVLGHQAIANAVALAVNAKYGSSIPVIQPSGTPASICS